MNTIDMDKEMRNAKETGYQQEWTAAFIALHGCIQSLICAILIVTYASMI
jgi:hypothetical protein